jgi:hypothetical protein
MTTHKARVDVVILRHLGTFLLCRQFGTLLALRGWRASTCSHCSKKIAPFLVEDGAIRLLDLCSQAYAKRATSSWSTSVILTSELTGTNSLTPW